MISHYIVFDIFMQSPLYMVFWVVFWDWVPLYIWKMVYFWDGVPLFLKKRENERKIEYNREKCRYREILRDIERYVEILWCIRLTDITEPYIEPWYIAPRYIISLLDHRKCKVLSVKYFYLTAIRQNESCKNYQNTSYLKNTP